MNWTEEQYIAYLAKQGRAKPEPKKTKYNNKGIWRDGIYFRSQLECKRYCQLRILFNTGKIAGFVTQPEFILQEGNEDNRAITYKADFLVINNDGTYTLEDTKGMETDQWKRTYKMFKLRYPKIELKIIKKV